MSAAIVRLAMTPSWFFCGVLLASVIISGSPATAQGYEWLQTKSYRKGDKVELKVNALTSVTAQLPYSYYYLPYCKPHILTSQVDSLGEILVGDILQNSEYKVDMLTNRSCEALCERLLTNADRNKYKQMIDDEYTVNWVLDGLPAVYPYFHGGIDRDVEWYKLGFPVGWSETDGFGHQRYFLHNFLSIIVKYRTSADPLTSPTHPLTAPPVGGAKRKLEAALEKSDLTYQIVGFEVIPISYSPPNLITQNTPNPAEPKPTKQPPRNFGFCKDIPEVVGEYPPATRAVLTRDAIPTKALLDLDHASSVTFLYDVQFEHTPHIQYSSRWDSYLDSQRVGLGTSALEVHWFSILNSLAVVLALSGVVATILIRTLNRDIIRYNEILLSKEEELEESGWKLVHGDVFRKPQHSTILAALTGSGVQILAMAIVTFAVAAIGTSVYPATGYGRGRLLQFSLLLWSFMGALGGYTAARFYKLFQSPNWKMTTFRTAVMYPGVFFSTFLIINIFLAFNSSSAAVPFSIIFLLMLIWFGVSTPLIFIGAYFGFKQAAISIPVRVNKIPREVPVQPTAVHPIITCLAGGALPFGAVFTELLFVMRSIWLQRTYMLYGLLLIVTFILIITCAEIAIAMTYFQLVCEDYNWWWRSFMIPASSSIYVLVYALIHLVTRLSLAHFTAILLYIGYSIILAYTFFIVAGSIGFMASFLFVRAIYGSIRVD